MPDNHKNSYTGDDSTAILDDIADFDENFEDGLTTDRPPVDHGSATDDEPPTTDRVSSAAPETDEPILTPPSAPGIADWFNTLGETDTSGNQAIPIKGILHHDGDRVGEFSAPVDKSCIVARFLQTDGPDAGQRGCGPGQYTVFLYGPGKNGHKGNIGQISFHVTEGQAIHYGWIPPVEPDEDEPEPRTAPEPTEQQLLVAYLKKMDRRLDALENGAGNSGGLNGIAESILAAQLKQLNAPKKTFMERAQEVTTAIVGISGLLKDDDLAGIVDDVKGTVGGFLKARAQQNSEGLDKLIPIAESIGGSLVEFIQSKTGGGGGGGGDDMAALLGATGADGGDY